jgi:hypothetical protein
MPRRTIRRRPHRTVINLPPPTSPGKASSFSAPPAPTLEDTLSRQRGLLAVQPIGMVRSICRLRVGTPLQGLGAVHPLMVGDSSTTADDSAGSCTSGLVFVFHL